jgi:glycerophosphoryl diester phosphodiesterase family protein
LPRRRHGAFVKLEIQAHRANDALTLRRVLATRPATIEVDVGLGPSGLVVAHDTDLADASGLTVDDVLAAAGATSVMLDVKCFPPATPGRASFMKALRPYLGRVSICSFDEQLIAAVGRTRPSTPTTFLFTSPLEAATSAQTLGPRHDLVTRELVDAAHAVGARVVPWTVNDAREMAALIELGVDGLVTDRPGLAQAVLADLDRQERRSVA